MLFRSPYSAMSDELQEEALEEGSIGIAALRSTDSLLSKKWSASGDTEENTWKLFDGLNLEVRATTATATILLRERNLSCGTSASDDNYDRSSAFISTSPR